VSIKQKGGGEKLVHKLCRVRRSVRADLRPYILVYACRERVSISISM
jgi:hypothetical protein